MSKPNISALDGAGAEITGVDLTQLDADTFAIIQDTFNQYGLVFFRDQSLMEQDHEGLRAVHSAKHIFGGATEHIQRGDYSGRLGNAAATEQLVDPVHTVVIRHPLSPV